MDSKALREILDSLYSTFLARDLFAKVIPGSLILYTVLNAISVNGSSGTLKDLNIIGWLIFFGISWTIGFAVQGIGECTSLHRPNPRNENYEVFLKRKSDFINNTGIPQEARNNRERFVVIKETTANLGTSLIILIIFNFFVYKFPEQKEIIAYILVAIIAIILLWYHAVHRERQRDFESVVLDSNRPEETDTGHPEQTDP